jgi:hypothetical protein
LRYGFLGRHPNGAHRLSEVAHDCVSSVRIKVSTPIGLLQYPQPAHLRCGSEPPMCGRLRVGKENLHVAGLGRLRPCVRPVSAVRMTAGHNALRGSGPGQKLAFADAVALVGCPDRRIDRLCITCCSPSQLLHHAGWPGAISFTLRARRVPCSAHPLPLWPKPFARSCWQARLRPPWSAAAPTAP